MSGAASVRPPKKKKRMKKSVFVCNLLLIAATVTVSAAAPAIINVNQVSMAALETELEGTRFTKYALVEFRHL
jgi:hypothetical protein